MPIHLQEAFHEEIRNLEALGVLEETKDVTEWVNSFVIIEKKLLFDSSNAHSPGHTVKKKLRICLDPRDLNEALEREPYYTCSIEEIIGKFYGMTKFTIADFNKGYCCIVNVHIINVFIVSSLYSCEMYKQVEEMVILHLFIEHHYKSIVSIIRVKHILTLHLSTANCRIKLTTGCCKNVAAHIMQFLPDRVNTTVPQVVAYFNALSWDI